MTTRFSRLKVYLQRSSKKKLALLGSGLLLLLLLLALGGYLLFLTERVDHNLKREDLLPQPSTTSESTTTPPTATASTAIPKPVKSTPVAPASKPTAVPSDTYPTVAGKAAPHLTDEQEEYAPPAPIPATGPDPAQPTRLASQGNSRNYLIIGSDHRGSERGRSDVIIVVHVTGGRSSVHLIHFPRDYFVRIPGKGYDKVNAAYSLGGAPLLVRTLQPLLGVPIDHVAILDFNGFTRMTDAVGGVDITVPKNAGGAGYQAGHRYHMNGAQALAFVRERHHLNQGDIGRGDRQMAYVEALFAKGVSPAVILNPSRFTSFLDAGTKNTTVDKGLSMNELRSMAWDLRGLTGDSVFSWSAPWTHAGYASNGRDVVFPSSKQLSQLQHHLQTDSMNSYQDTVSPKRGFSR